MRKIILAALLAVSLVGCSKPKFMVLTASTDEDFAAIGENGCDIVSARWAKLTNNLDGLYDKWGYEVIVKCP